MKLSLTYSLPNLAVWIYQDLLDALGHMCYFGSGGL